MICYAMPGIEFLFPFGSEKAIKSTREVKTTTDKFQEALHNLVQNTSGKLTHKQASHPKAGDPEAWHGGQTS